MKRISLLATVLAIGLFAALGTPAKALTIVPPSLEYSVKPGDSIQAKIKLFNEGQTATTVFASIANFTAKGEQGEPDFQFQDTPTGTASWIDAPAGALTIQPNDRIEIPVTINVPKNAEPGGHYASVFFGTDPSLKAKEGGQVTVRSLIGTLVILRVDGEVRESASVASFGVAGGKKNLSSLPVNFDLRIKNTGNVHIRPQGTILIKNLFGGETTTLNLNDANGAVLPNSIRDFSVTWKKDLVTQKKASFFSKLGIEWKNFALGPYTATATVTYGQTKQNLVTSATVTIIPWELLIVTLLLLVIVVTVLVLGMKAYNNAIIRKAQSLPPTAPKK